MLRIGQAVEARRGYDRDAGDGPAPLEGDPDGAGALQLPGLREDHAAAGALPRHAARLCRPEPSRHDPVREVRPAPALEPAERALSPGRGSSSASRRSPTRSAPARRRCGRSRADRGACAGGRAAARRRHHGADPGQGQDDDGRIWTYVRDDRPFGSRAPPAALFYASRDRSGEHPSVTCAASAASCRPTPMAATTGSTVPRAGRGGHAGVLLGACPAAVLRAGRHRRPMPGAAGRRR